MNVSQEQKNREQMISLLADKLTKASEKIAAILILTARDEAHLLDGIKIANDGIRMLACEGYVKLQKEKGK